MIQPNEDDRKAADEILERLLGKPAIKISSWEKDVADLAQFHAEARAAERARCVKQVLDTGKACTDGYAREADAARTDEGRSHLRGAHIAVHNTVFFILQALGLTAAEINLLRSKPDLE